MTPATRTPAASWAPSGSAARSTIAPQTRAYLWLLVGVIATWGLPLYLYPSGAIQYWAWEAAHPRSAMLVGAIYFVSALYYIVLARQRQWLQVRTCLRSLFVVAAWLLVVAMVEWASFHPYRLETLSWLASYYLPLFALPVIFRLQRDRGGVDAADGPRIARGWQVWIAVRAVLYTPLALYVFFTATSLSHVWPWPIEPVNVRMFSGQLALFGVFPAFALDDGLWKRAKHFFAICGWLGAAHLVALGVAGGDYDTAVPLAWLLPAMFAEWTLTPIALWLSYRR